MKLKFCEGCEGCEGFFRKKIENKVITFDQLN